jgi:hypothetical protein
MCMRRLLFILAGSFVLGVAWSAPSWADKEGAPVLSTFILILQA